MKTTKMKKSAYILYLLACSMLLFFSSCERNDIYEKAKKSALSIIDLVGTPYIKLFQGALELTTGSSVNIGEAAIAGSGNSLTFTVRNTGNRNLGLTGSPVPVSISGAGSGDYTITQPATDFVAPGGSVPFSINFVPSASGTRDATLTIQNDDPNGDPFIINLTGNGLVPMLVVHGDTSNRTSIYDPAKNQFTSGPNLPVNVFPGGFSFTIPSGLYAGQQLILHADLARTTTVYNPATGSTTPGPTHNNVIGWGAHSFPISGGRVLVVCAGVTPNTNIYDPGPPHFFSPGPSLWLSDNAGKGANSIFDSVRGTWIINHAGSTNNTEFTLSTSLTANGPGMPNPMIPDDGSHSFISSTGSIFTIYGAGGNVIASYFPGTLVPDVQGFYAQLAQPLADPAGSGAHTFLIAGSPYNNYSLTIHGGGLLTTTLWNLSDTLSPGPSMTGTGASSGSHSFQITSGPKAGCAMVILGGGSNATAIFDPNAVPFSNAFSAGPPLTGNADQGAHSFPAR